MLYSGFRQLVIGYAAAAINIRRGTLVGVAIGGWVLCPSHRRSSGTLMSGSRRMLNSLWVGFEFSGKRLQSPPIRPLLR